MNYRKEGGIDEKQACKEKEGTKNMRTKKVKETEAECESARKAINPLTERSERVSCYEVSSPTLPNRVQPQFSAHKKKKERATERTNKSTGRKGQTRRHRNLFKDNNVFVYVSSVYDPHVYLLISSQRQL